MALSDIQHSEGEVGLGMLPWTLKIELSYKTQAAKLTCDPIVSSKLQEVRDRVTMLRC